MAADNSGIPSWLKIAATVFLLGTVMILVRSLEAQKGIFLLSTTVLILASAALVIIFGMVAVLFWAFPERRVTRLIYFFLRFFRIPISVFSVLGIVYILVIHAPLFTLRGAGALLVLGSTICIEVFLTPIAPGELPFRSVERFFTRISGVTQKINSAPRWTVCLGVAVLPVLIAGCVVYFGFHAKLSYYRPYSSWNDETSYWLWDRAFSQVGLNVGYNAPDEMIARAGFNRYGEDSPLYIYFYGMIAKIVGWSPELPLLIDFFILSIAIFAFTYFTRLDPLQIILTGLVTVTTWPIILYLLTTSHETLNQVIAFVMAGIFLILLTGKNRVNWVARLAFVVFVYFATLLRLSWGLMLIPVIFYIFEGPLLRRVILSILLGSGLFVSAILITSYLVPPVNNSIFRSFGDVFTSGPQFLINYMWGQLRALFSSGLNNSNLAIVFEILVIIGWNLVRLLQQIRSRVRVEAILSSPIVFDIYNMVTLLLASLMFYLNWAFFRTLAPSVLVISLLKVAKKDYKFVVTLLLINLAFYSAYFDAQNTSMIYNDFTKGYTNEAFVETEINKYVLYDPAATNPWCNTLLIPLNFYDYRLIIIPPGIGVSYILDTHDIRPPIKSQYLLLDTDTYAALSNVLHVKLLDSLDIGKLYINLDANCTKNH